MTQLSTRPHLQATLVESPRVVRWLWMALGLSCVALGAVGAVVPGMPTTIFLMIACWAFAKSCPALHRWVLTTRLFAPYARYLDGSTAMPIRAKAVAIALMWVSVALSCTVLVLQESAPDWVAVLVVAAAVAGTAFIVRWQPRGVRDAQAA